MTEPEPQRPAQPLSQELESDLHDWIGTLVGARKLIGLITAVVLLGSLAVHRLGTPIYRADTLVQVKEKRNAIAGLDDMLGGLGPERATDTEIEILRSRSLLTKVIDTLSLDVLASPRRFPLVGGAIARAWRGTTPAAPVAGLDRFAWGGELITVPRLEVPPGLENEKLVLTADEGGRYALQDPEGAPLLQGTAGVAAGEVRDEAGHGSAVKLFVSELRARPGTQFILVKRPLQEAIAKLQKDLVIAEKGKKTGSPRRSARNQSGITAA